MPVPKFNDALTLCTVGTKIIPPSDEDDYMITMKDSSPFYGQIGPVYMFSDAVSSEEIQGIYSLGPSYMYSFLDNEDVLTSDNPLPDGILSAKDGLASKIIFGINAQASNGKTLFNVSQAPDNALDKSTFEATVMAGTQLCSRRLLQEIIYCVGGVTVFFPLLTEFDRSLNPDSDPLEDVLLRCVMRDCLTAEVIELIAYALDENPANQQQMHLLSGFSILGFLLQSLPPNKINLETLSALKHLFNVVVNCGLSELLVKDAILSIFLNPFIWLYTSYEVQRELYMFLIHQFDNDPRLLSRLCRLPRVIDMIQQFYWDQAKFKYAYGGKPLLHPVSKEVIGERPSPEDVRKIRLLLLSLGEMSLRQNVAESDIKALVAFFEKSLDMTCIEDVLHMVTRAVSQKPLLASFLEQVNLLCGCQMFVNLLNREHEQVRLLGLQFLGRLLVGLPSEKKGARFFSLAVGRSRLLSESHKKIDARLQPIFSAMSDRLFQFPQTDLLCATLFDVLLGGASPKQVLQKHNQHEKLKTKGNYSHFLLPQILVLIFRFFSSCNNMIARVKILKDLLDLLDSSPSNILAFMGENAYGSLVHVIFEDLIERLIALSSEHNIFVSQPCRDNTLYLLKLIDEILVSEMGHKLPYPGSSSEFPPDCLEFESFKDHSSGKLVDFGNLDSQLQRALRVCDQNVSREDYIVEEKWWNMYDKVWIIIGFLNGKGPNKMLPKSSSSVGPSLGQRARGLVESLNIPAAEMAAVVVSGGISNALSGKPNKTTDKAMILRGEKCPRVVFRLLALYLCKSSLERASRCVQQVVPIIPCLLAADDEQSKSRLQLFIWKVSQFTLIQNDKVLAALAEEDKYMKNLKSDRARQLQELNGRMHESSSSESSRRNTFEGDVQNSMTAILSSDDSRIAAFQLTHDEDQEIVAFMPPPITALTKDANDIPNEKTKQGTPIPEQMKRLLLKGVRRITDEGSIEPQNETEDSKQLENATDGAFGSQPVERMKDSIDQKDLVQERKELTSSVPETEISEVLICRPCVLVKPKRKVAGHLAVMKNVLHFFGEFLVEGTGGSSVFNSFNALINSEYSSDQIGAFHKQKLSKWPSNVDVQFEKGQNVNVSLADRDNLLKREPKVRRHRRWEVSKVKSVHWTRYLLRYTTIEIFFSNSVAPVFFNFASQKDAKEVGKLIVSARNECLFPKGSLRDRSGVIAFLDRRAALEMAENAQERWRRREISNFEYLMVLNTLAGRSYNDLTQYPVFPWVLADYSSEKLDFNKSSTFRDLSKPVGALDAKRFEGGKFDHADRLFQSIEGTFRNCMSNTSDVKELIPEFFYMPDFLINSNSYHLGIKQDGEPLGHVSLPPWAKGSPEEFIQKNREALESEYVSSNLHLWIDLVFGYKQRGKLAEEAANIFYYLTYEGAVDLETMEDELQRSAIEDQIANFGQTPIQVFRKKHPRRGPPIPIAHPLYFAPSSIDLTSIISSTTHPPSSILYIDVLDSCVVLVNQGLSMSVKMWLTTQLQSGGNLTFSGSQDPFFGIGSDIISPRKIGSPVAENVELGAQFFAAMQTPSENFLISCGNWENSFQVISLNDGRTVQTVRQHKDVVSCVAVTTDGTILATGSHDTTVMVWEVCRARHTEKRVRSSQVDVPRKDYVIVDTPFHILCGHDDIITCLFVSIELDIVISGSKDGTCIFHTLREGRYVRSLQHPSGCALSKLVASQHGRIVFYAEDDLSLNLYSINGKHIATSESNGRLNCVELSVCGEYLVCAGDHGHIVVRSMNSLEVVKRYDGIGKVITSLAVTQEECFLAGTKEGILLVYSIENPQLRRSSLPRNVKSKVSAIG
ncbi:hypothetical protein Sjap_010519 [Stephania japonica]|uniref:Uncharacterized protein n=1 Tax=Stephania japonica TaxID=461633 RepID=A0AAP0J9A2_9MAGN